MLGSHFCLCSDSLESLVRLVAPVMWHSQCFAAVLLRGWACCAGHRLRANMPAPPGPGSKGLHSTQQEEFPVIKCCGS